MTGIPKIGQRTDEALIEQVAILLSEFLGDGGRIKPADEKAARIIVRRVLAAVPDVAETIARDIEAEFQPFPGSPHGRSTSERCAAIARSHTTRQDTT